MARTTTADPRPAAVSHDAAVRERYAAAATERQPALCCPVDYDRRYLERIPDEIIERDYGCGDPSRHLRAGDRVLDLGSGGGKICYIASQVVGAAGRVIGVDSNDEMLALARRYQPVMAERLGYGNVEFRRGNIQDLELDLDRLDTYLRRRPVADAAGHARLEEEKQRLRRESPLIPDGAVDVVVSNCVLNLVRPDDRRRLFAEIHRVLARGGRAVISDIVSDEDVPEHLRRDPELWSGCISGAWREDRFLEAFAGAGLYGVEILSRGEEPWSTIEGIQFRSITVRAWKGKEGPCLERLQAVIYRGPWKTVVDDDGHTLHRGERMAVCDKTFHIYTSEPYGDQVIPVAPHVGIPLDEAAAFACTGAARRHPRATKGEGYDVTEVAGGDGCGPDCC